MGVVDDSRFSERAFEDALAGSGSESDEDPLLNDAGNDDDVDDTDLAAALAAGGSSLWHGGRPSEHTPI